MKCPACGAENRIGALICASCHTDLYDSLLEKVSTKQLHGHDTSELVDGKAPSSNPIVLYLATTEAPIALERRDNLILGRKESETDKVSLDFTPFDGKDYGVSRFHARLDGASNAPTLTDLGSTNGTYVNGQKLQQNMPHLLRSGDEVRFGRLVVRLYFK
jgi:hypothetical protein